ncbi:flagellar hook-associated protein 3 [Baekduia soli]|uniref:Flagellar hook-associated protein 3 n=1 Tax=Baekduia soli TaxID=496014 RepID=A0A5B8U1C0_9ACTN|nr:flagellar hook-associated protein FlgL [Baekduia soli]QEC46819.1 flagellar hook-associated protein 3 [Baekduia soli]
MRLTNSTIGNRVLADLQASYTRMATTQEQISSGRRVNRPSDDPVAAATERLRNGDLEGIRRSQESVNTATSWLGASETALSSVNDVLSRARELAVQGANGTNNQAARNQIADEIDQLVKSAKDAVNVKVGDAYIFSGTRSDVAPYADATGDAYQGDAGAVTREAGPGATLQLNPPFAAVGATPAGSTEALTGASLLGGGAGAADGRVLDVLQTLSAHLRGGTAADITAIQNSDLGRLQTVQTAVSNARGAVGITLNRAEAATSRLQDLQELTTQGISDLTGVDLAKALTDYTSQQSAYQATLKVGAQIIQPSLVDFLR